ncbi:MAG: DUF4214 domain-containing protein [Lachnospiraceae bacterium]|nr:DUF4214 domain-containing protein [Lachnospiraceae bacterium]
MTGIIKRSWMALLLTLSLLLGVVMPTQTVLAATHTRDEAIDWVFSQLGNGIDYDGVYGNQCVDLIMAYYEYLGVKPVRGNGADYVSNELPEGWQRIEGAAPQKGDILVYTGGYGGYGHVGIYESDYVHYHQNVKKDYVECITDWAYNGFSTHTYWGVIRPDFMTTEGSENDGGTYYDGGTNTDDTSETGDAQQPETEQEIKTKAFVTRLYEVGLGRQPEEQGLNDWTGRLLSGEADAVDVVQGILCSLEYAGQGKSNGEIVTDCYSAMLNRAPDEAGYRDWTSKLDAGMTVNAIFAGFVESPEFDSLCQEYGINPGSYVLTENRDMYAGSTMFISRLYTETLARAYDVDGLNDWTGRINADPSRENILNISTDGFLHSQEFIGRGLNDSEYVEVMYRTYLNREGEAEGLKDWIGKLEQGDLSRDEVAAGFAYSQEFDDLMKGYGL